VPGFPVYGLDRYAAVVAGAVAPLGDPSVGALAALGLLVAAAALAVTIGIRLREAPGRLLLVLLGVTLALSVVVFARARWVSEDGYVAVKALISAGALSAGLLAIGLLLPAPRRVAALGLAALAACLAVWLPQSGDLLARATDGDAGFREDDVALGAALRDLPPGTVMVDVDLENADGYLLRGTIWHLAADVAGLGVDGAQGDGGTPLPLVPWDYVAERRPSPFSANRTTIWEGQGYRLAAAPDLDVVPWGTAWHGAARGDGGVEAWTMGDAELVVSNRADRDRGAVLRLVLSSHGVARNVVLTSGLQTASKRIPAGRDTVMELLMAAPAHTTLAMTMTATPLPTPEQPLALVVRSVSIRDAFAAP
jgi:hypothetical protein